MARNSTKNLVSSISGYMSGKVSCLLNRQDPFPRWKPPTGMSDGTFAKDAADQYREEITKDKDKQDAERLVNRGNEFYMNLTAQKAYGLMSRSRVISSAIGLSMDRGMSDQKGFLASKYISVGDKVGANET